MFGTSTRVSLFISCLCLSWWSFCAGQSDASSTQTFSLPGINCKLEWTDFAPSAIVTLTCSSLRDIHVATDEHLLDQILTKAFDKLKPEDVIPRKLIFSLSNVHLSLEALNLDLTMQNIETELLLNSCAIQSLKREFFASRQLFTVSRSGSSVRFHNCRFVGMACIDLATAFNTALNLLEFSNCTWCPGDVTLAKVNARNLILHLVVPQPDLTLHLTDSNVRNNLSVTVDSGWQQMRLGQVRPGHLTLTGVQLLGPLGASFLKDANLYSMRLRRCQLPSGAADDLLRNVRDVGRIQIDETDLDGLPLVPRPDPLRPALSLEVLEVTNCRPTLR